MRLLEFQVNQQMLRKLPGSDFSGIVAGSSGYLHAKFYFTNGWEGSKKVVVFNGEDEQDYAVLLDENNECAIPSKALTGKIFEVTLYGATNGAILHTNALKVKQEVN